MQVPRSTRGRSHGGRVPEAALLPEEAQSSQVAPPCSGSRAARIPHNMMRVQELDGGRMSPLGRLDHRVRACGAAVVQGQAERVELASARGCSCCALIHRAAVLQSVGQRGNMPAACRRSACACVPGKAAAPRLFEHLRVSPRRGTRAHPAIVRAAMVKEVHECIEVPPPSSISRGLVVPLRTSEPRPDDHVRAPVEGGARASILVHAHAV
mmetsp:Transcript_27556/g.74185  ORF Transcript_27556/g.74185 Transcript_27556/m.74185 type:complete len:211 (+) Transcript_27556:279-911(+)